jgi:cysteine-rich repeat protein
MQRLSLRIHPLGLCVIGFTLSIGLSACSDDPSTTVDKDVAADTVADTEADTLADVVDPDVSGCGDGVMLGDEACDDGNVVDGDGCSATCTLETGFDCTGAPTLCTDIDECAATPSGCDLAADCTNTVGAFTCTCKPGYVGDGKVCTPKEDCGAVACDDSNPCTDDTCDKATGCVHANNPLPCTDDNVCTEDDGCSDGACVPGATKSCDDNNVCTTDSCDPKVGCANAPNTEPCDDKDACTTGDLCAAGACVPGGPTVCDDSNPCTDDACDLATGCTVTVNTAPCDDKDACTTGDTCALGACVSGGPTVCDDSNPCTDDGCDMAIGCTVTDNIAVCTDGDACTTGDICALGACVPGGPTVCTDGNSCTDNGCDKDTGCTVTQNTKACEDGNACTLTDKCTDGSCVAGAIDSCDDSKPCTTDSCDPVKGCANVANTSPCEDGSACTVGDVCAAGECKPGAAKSCDDSKPCTTDSCDPVKGCANVANTSACEDGNACTLTDKCKDGSCVAGAINSCDDSNPFTLDTCNAATGCAHAAKTCDPGYSCAPVTGACSMKVLISEVASDRWGMGFYTGTGFVGLYNPGETAASLVGLRLDGGSGLGFLSLIDSFGPGSSIPAHGYFLIGLDGYGNAVQEDVHTERSVPSSGVRLWVANGAVIDEIFYASSGDDKAPYPPGDQQGSIERKAYAGSTAETMSAGGADAAKGNSFDSGNSKTDFIVRPTRNPQNTASPIEKP